MKQEPAESVLVKLKLNQGNPRSFGGGRMSIVVLNQRENVQAI
jgi:hypothetical protein